MKEGRRQRRYCGAGGGGGHYELLWPPEEEGLAEAGEGDGSESTDVEEVGLEVESEAAAPLCRTVCRNGRPHGAPVVDATGSHVHHGVIWRAEQRGGVSFTSPRAEA